MDHKRFQTEPLNLVACSVFRPALECLVLEKRFSGLRTIYLPSQLHSQPHMLRSQLLETIIPLRQIDIPIVFLYGNCFPGIDDFCRDQGVKRIRGEHCYEIMLGNKHFQEIINETAGTYFLEQDLITHFEEYCVEPLELHDEEMRKFCFAHYRKLVYLRQPNDPDLNIKVKNIRELLKLSLETVNVDYSYLEKRLLDIIMKR